MTSSSADPDGCGTQAEGTGRVRPATSARGTVVGTTAVDEVPSRRSGSATITPLTPLCNKRDPSLPSAYASSLSTVETAHEAHR